MLSFKESVNGIKCLRVVIALPALTANLGVHVENSILQVAAFQVIIPHFVFSVRRQLVVAVDDPLSDFLNRCHDCAEKSSELQLTHYRL